MARNIEHTFFFEQAPQDVWEYLTRPELISQWLMENDFKPLVGHQFNFKTKPQTRFGFDGIVHCEVLEVVPCERLSYSWKGGIGDKVSLESVVIWTLTSKNNGTELKLEHNGFKGIRNYLAYFIMNKGWAKIGTRMQDLLKQNKK